MSMSKLDIKRWNIEDLVERFYSIAENEIIAYTPPVGSRAKPFTNKTMELTLDFASNGLKYYDCKNRLLVLGRACGGLPFKPERRVIKYDPSEKPTFVISREAIRRSIEAEISDNLDWLKSKELKYTPYIRLEKMAAEYLNPNLSGHWADFIAYSNLFKFISSRGGNPSAGLVRAQTNSGMADILRIELETLNPTHILLIVGEDNEYWYPGLFKEVIAKSGTPYVKVVNRPEVRKKDIRNSITDSISEWKNT